MRTMVRECWRARLRTTMSCQNQGRLDGAAVDLAWLQLPGSSAERFLDICSADLLDGDEAAKDLFCHIHHTAGWDADLRARWWRYDAGPVYLGGGVRLWVSIRFPVADLPLVTARLRAHNRADRSPAVGE